MLGGDDDAGDEEREENDEGFLTTEDIRPDPHPWRREFSSNRAPAEENGRRRRRRGKRVLTKSEREQRAPLPAWMLDPSLLPKKPPGRK